MQFMARIDWNVVSGVCAILSVAIAIIGLPFWYRGQASRKKSVVTVGGTIRHYLVFCAAWVSLVIAFNWIVSPFGLYLSTNDEYKLYGIMISVPALMLAKYALNGIDMQRERDDRKNDEP